MDLFLTLAFLFFIGSVCGWVLELFFRRFISAANPERKWINPGFCTGPYLPLYGSGLCILFLIAELEDFDWIADPRWERVVLFVSMAVCMTLIEYIAGILMIKVAKVRLWDYTNEWGNIQGIICPKFSFFWAVLGAAYYFLIHPHILNALHWLAQNLAFSFVIGMFYGVFVIDLCHSLNLLAKLKRFAEANKVVIRYENLKTHLRAVQERNAQRYRFFSPFRSQLSLAEHLQERLEVAKENWRQELELRPEHVFVRRDALRRKK